MVSHVKNGKALFDEALLTYIEKGSIKVLQSFFENDHSSTVDSSGRTLLHHAAQSNNVSMTQYFLDNKYDIDAQDDSGDTPLILAMENYSYETAKLLIKAGADIYYRDSEGRSILPQKSRFKYGRYPFEEMNESEIENKYRTIVKAILEKVRKDYWNDEQLLVDSLEDIKCTLIGAINLGDANVTRMMLDNGYSVDEREPETNDTALHKAVKLGDFENVKVLLKYGAKIHAEGGEKELTAVYNYNDYNPFLKVEDQRMKVLKILIDHGALRFQPNSRFLTPSKTILANGKLWATKIVMQHKDFKWDPYFSLYGLVSNRNSDVLEVICGKKIDLDSIDNPYKAPVLSFAAYFGKLRKVEFLLESGANPNVVGENGLTPLMSVCDYLFKVEKGHLPSLQLLLQYGADAQYTYQGEKTVFDVAMNRGQFDLLKPVIAHLVMIEGFGENITSLIFSKIISQETFINHFRMCKRQVKRMKNTTIYESVTLFKLLTESQSKITRYAYNEELAQNFKKSLKIRPVLDPYYMIALKRRVGKAIHVAKLQKEAVVMLNKIVGYQIKNYFEILNVIVNYLTCDDLKSLCKVYDLLETDSYDLNTLFM